MAHLCSPLTGYGAWYRGDPLFVAEFCLTLCWAMSMLIFNFSSLSWGRHSWRRGRGEAVWLEWLRLATNAWGEIWAGRSDIMPFQDSQSSSSLSFSLLSPCSSRTEAQWMGPGWQHSSYNWGFSTMGIIFNMNINQAGLKIQPSFRKILSSVLDNVL